MIAKINVVITNLLKTDNRGQLKNHDIFGALYTSRIQYNYTQAQCEDGARDIRVILLTPVISIKNLGGERANLAFILNTVF